MWIHHTRRPEHKQLWPHQQGPHQQQRMSSHYKVSGVGLWTPEYSHMVCGGTQGPPVLGGPLGQVSGWFLTMQWRCSGQAEPTGEEQVEVMGLWAVGPQMKSWQWWLGTNWFCRSCCHPWGITTTLWLVGWLNRYPGSYTLLWQN